MHSSSDLIVHYDPPRFSPVTISIHMGSDVDKQTFHALADHVHTGMIWNSIPLIPTIKIWHSRELSNLLTSTKALKSHWQEVATSKFANIHEMQQHFLNF